MNDINKTNRGNTEFTGDLRLVIVPNCSISWLELILFYGVTCSIALAIGVMFALQGLWFVLPFSGIEMLALGVVLYLTSRRMRFKEVITFDDSRVSIEKGFGEVEYCWEFDRSWLQLYDQTSDDFRSRRQLKLGSHGNYVEVGEFLNLVEKDELAFRLKRCIIAP